MPDLSRACAYNVLAKSPAVRPSGVVLPIRNGRPMKQAVLAPLLPSLRNGAGLPVISSMTSSLPRESSPRIMNPADVPPAS